MGLTASILAVGPYHWLAARWQKFGVGTFLGLLVCIVDQSNLKDYLVTLVAAQRL